MSAAAHKHLHLIKGTLTRNHLPLLLHALLVGLLLSVPGSNLRGGSTGKIAGLVQDVLTGEGIAGANIIIEGTYLGAATDADGYYVILNVPPGIYVVQVTVTGYTIEPRGSVRGVNALREFLTGPIFTPNRGGSSLGSRSALITPESVLNNDRINRAIRERNSSGIDHAGP
ncbi:MAG: carboxypeptidase-like regulatory domain-containing protein [Candidatus Marinimicrobia bacterium]|nr:carboxypeptidase-like regulatory domain-containing protein [Candidatus Neomarinimicrobiota bacterium]